MFVFVNRKKMWNVRKWSILSSLKSMLWQLCRSGCVVVLACCPPGTRLSVGGHHPHGYLLDVTWGAVGPIVVVAMLGVFPPVWGVVAIAAIVVVVHVPQSLSSSTYLNNCNNARIWWITMRSGGDQIWLISVIPLRSLYVTLAQPHFSFVFNKNAR